MRRAPKHLSELEVFVLRAFANGGCPTCGCRPGQVDLGAVFGLEGSSVNRVIHGRTRGDVGEPPLRSGPSLLELLVAGEIERAGGLEEEIEELESEVAEVAPEDVRPEVEPLPPTTALRHGAGGPRFSPADHRRAADLIVDLLDGEAITRTDEIPEPARTVAQRAAFMRAGAHTWREIGEELGVPPGLAARAAAVVAPELADPAFPPVEHEVDVLLEVLGGPLREAAPA